VGVTFLTPVAALLALAAVVPLVVFARRRQRARHVRRTLGLAEPSRRVWVPLAACLGLVPVLIGVAAAQPVVTNARVLSERTDAEVFIVLDISRSMLASEAPDAPTRFERAREETLAFEGALAEVPVGIASLTDRVLPHLFPTTDRRVFVATAKGSVGVDRPPPRLGSSGIATRLEAIGVVSRLKYFSPTATRRVLVVYTDGESQPLSNPTTLAADFARRPRVETIFVRFGSAKERIYETGVVEQGFRPDPAVRAALQHVASLVHGRVFEEGEVDEIVAAVREGVGSGPTRERRHEGRRFALMPYVALAAVLPLGFVLLRRNL